MNNEIMTILNYPGSKKNLLGFIKKNTLEYVPRDKAFLDIFAGTSSVGYNMKKDVCVYSNDSERYSYEIAKALIENNKLFKFDMIKEKFLGLYYENKKILIERNEIFIKKEEKALEEESSEDLIRLYNDYLCIWQKDDFEGQIKSRISFPYDLFMTYYSTTYFGFLQSCEIDSIRYAIEYIQDELDKAVLLASLFFAMKESVFSKDGHMAQPLNTEKNSKVLMKRRKVSIIEKFLKKISAFSNEEFIRSNFENRAYNHDFKRVIEDNRVKENVGFVYADPPYTDMQYSRYFHLLNTVVLYDYPNISKTRGALSKGLYREGRFQSGLSQKSNAKTEIEILMKYCKETKKNLGVSFAYPVDIVNQNTSRYTMSMDELIGTANDIFGVANVDIKDEDYEHSNNRNSERKKVKEYLVLCKY